MSTPWGTPEAPEAKRNPLETLISRGFFRASYQNRTDDLFITSETRIINPFDLESGKPLDLAVNPGMARLLKEPDLDHARLFPHSYEYTMEYTKRGGAKMEQKISLEQIQALNHDEQRAMLFYLTGFLENSAEFQDALTRAYDAEMRMRARMAARA